MIWLIGYKGMLGREISDVLKEKNMDFVATDVEIDITNYQILKCFAEKYDFTYIINCAAYTAVDKAEEEKDIAFMVNGVGVRNIAEIAKQTQSVFIHISTDYVFDGEKQTPYIPEDIPNPKSIYGKTKLTGEYAIVSICRSFFIIRISWLYGRYGNNFVTTMLSLFEKENFLNIVNDQIGSPTYASVLAENIVRLIASGNNEFGIYHYADKGYIAWYDFAMAIRDILIEENFFPFPSFPNISPEKLEKLVINPVTSEKFIRPAPRPKNSRFDTSKTVEKLNFRSVYWRDNLLHFLRAYSPSKLPIYRAPFLRSPDTQK